MAVMLSSNVLPALAQTSSIGSISLNPSIKLLIDGNSPRIVVSNRAVQQYTDYSRLRYKLFLTSDSQEVYSNDSVSSSGMNTFANDSQNYTYDSSASARAYQFAMRWNFGNKDFSKQLMCSFEDQYVVTRLAVLTKDSPRMVDKVSSTENVTVPAFSSSSTAERKEFCARFDITPRTTYQYNPNLLNPNLLNPNLIDYDQNKDDQEDDDNQIDDRCRNFTTALPDDCYNDDQDEDRYDDDMNDDQYEDRYDDDDRDEDDDDRDEDDDRYDDRCRNFTTALPDDCYNDDQDEDDDRPVTTTTTTVNPGLANYFPGLGLNLYSPADYNKAFEENKKERNRTKKEKNRKDLIDRLSNPEFPDFKYDLDDINLTTSEEKEVENERRRAEKLGTKTMDDDKKTKVKKDYRVSTPSFYYDYKSGTVKVDLYAPKSFDFDQYIFDVSVDKESALIEDSMDGQKAKFNNKKKQTQTVSAKDLLCKDYSLNVYGSAAVVENGKVVSGSQSRVANFRIPALTMKSSDSRKKMCEYKESTTLTDQVDQDTNTDRENRYAPDSKLNKKVKVKFDLNTKSPITGKDAGVLRPSLNWAFDLTRDLVSLVPNLSEDKKEDLYEKTKENRDDLVDRIQTAYPGKWPGFKEIFLDLRESVEVEADTSSDDSDLDEAANGLFDVNFDYTLMLTLAKKVKWNDIPTYSPEVLEEVEEQEEAADTQIEEEAESPVDTLITIADVDLPDLTVAIDPIDLSDDLIYESEEVPTEQSDVADGIQSQSDKDLTENLNNLWDYNFEYEIPEFDFSVCQRSYDPVTDGTFTDLAYNQNDVESLAAHCLKANNIIGGYSDFTFRPEKLVNRAEAAKFLMVSKFFSIEEVFNEFAKESFVEVFPDVPANQWYTEFVTVANRTGVINGYMDSTYKPANTVSTGEFFKMLLSANPTGLTDSQIDFLKSQEQTLVPVDGSVWGPEFFYVVQKFNLLESRTGSQTSVDFNAPMTRGEVSVAIFKYLRDVTPDSELLINR